MAKIFGFQINREKAPDLPAVVPPSSDLGQVDIAGGGVFGQVLDLDGSVRTEAELIVKYREMAENPDIDLALSDITNESIVVEENIDTIKIILDDLDKINIPDSIKKVMEIEFTNILQLLEFNTHPYEIFKRWYIDGRLYFQILLDPKDIQAGIQELRYIDPRKIRKIREIREVRDSATNAVNKKVIAEYYLYNDKGFVNSGSSIVSSGSSNGPTGVRIAPDTIIQCTSGISSAKGDVILSYLHPAIKPLNQLRSLEDSLVIYRISRAPERRIFYIDIGNLPKMKAEQYLRDQMVRFKNKIVYDSSTGEIRDDRKFMTMLEDFWLPRREGGRGTEITTLPGGQNLSQIDDIIYFQRRLFRSLQVPITRLDPEALFNYGRANEITRDEVKFAKFIARVRLKFAELFTTTLGRQLIFKNVFTPEEWDQVSHLLKYKYATDSYFEELKESEIMNERINSASMLAPFVGRYFSNAWVQKNVFHQTEDDMKEMRDEIKEEFNDVVYYPPLPPMGSEDMGGVGGMQQQGPQFQQLQIPQRPMQNAASSGPAGKKFGQKPNGKLGKK